jgi:acyl-CoA reductase-like NAD-dependent aldehyde dehydrogenase
MASAVFVEPDLRDERLKRRRDHSMLIAGADRHSASGQTIEREAPAHIGFVVASYPLGPAEDVDAAVAAARRAFDDGPWPRMSAGERSRVMMRVTALLDAHREELATIESLEAGKPIVQARNEIGGSIDLWEYAAGQVRGLHGEVYTNLGPDVVGMVIREPVGVVGVITPWNFPIIIACEWIPWIIGVGSTLVIKPGEFTSGTTVRLAGLIREAGVPEGVVNVATGYGDPVGEALTRHPGVDMISFTGSLRVGRAVGAAAAAIVQKTIVEDFLSRLSALTSPVTFGDPLNEETMAGVRPESTGSTNTRNSRPFTRSMACVTHGSSLTARVARPTSI